MCYFPRAAAVCGSLLGPICILEPQLQALQCCRLRNGTKQKTEILNSFQPETVRGRLLLHCPKQHKTWNQYFSWQRTLEVVLFAQRLIGHRVNCLSIHHEHLLRAGSKIMPKTNSSRRCGPWTEARSSPEWWISRIITVLLLSGKGGSVWILQSNTQFLSQLTRCAWFLSPLSSNYPPLNRHLWLLHDSAPAEPTVRTHALKMGILSGLQTTKPPCWHTLLKGRIQDTVNMISADQLSDLEK